MALTPSTMLSLGTPAPDFRLPDPDGKLTGLTDFAGAKGLAVIFICNHCPYVKWIRTALADFAREYHPQGVATVAINSNDIANYPADSPEKMREEIQVAGYDFPYLFDETQEVAKAYRAACTPDPFLFDGERRLFYRGQLDATRPGDNRPATANDFRAATDALLAGAPPPENQIPSMGCNIKWKPDNAPD